MKKLFAATILTLLSIPALAQLKVEDMTELTVPDYNDLWYVVHDPEGTPVARNMKIGVLREYKNVKDFGAVGDGETDDTNSIQAAYDAAAAVGCTTYFPAGTYAITSAIDVDSYGKFKGEAGKSIILQLTASTPLFNNTPAANVEQLIFEGLVFDADDTGCVGWYNPGYYTAYTEFRDCQFRRDLSVSIKTVPGHFRMYNCIDGKSGALRTSHQAIDFDSTPSKSAFTVLIEGCWFWKAAGVNSTIYDRSGNTLTFSSCTWQGCNTTALRADSVRNVLMLNCNFEDMEPNAADPNNCLISMKVDSDAVPGNITFSNCWVQNNATNHWVAWTYLTTSGADAKAEFHACSGNMGNAYWTKTSSTYDLPTNTIVTHSNPINNSSSFGSSYSIGRTATFHSGIYVKNSRTSSGYIDMYEDSDNGSNYYRQIAPSTADSNGVATWPEATGTVVVASASSHSYGSGTTAWSMTKAEAAGTLFTVTLASGPADAVFPAAVAGKMYTVYNNSGQTITFKVSGHTGHSVATAKYAIGVMNTTDCVELYEQP